MLSVFYGYDCLCFIRLVYFGDIVIVVYMIIEVD